MDHYWFQRTHWGLATFLEVVGNLGTERVVFLELADVWEEDFLDKESSTNEENGRLKGSYQPNVQGGPRGNSIKPPWQKKNMSKVTCVPPSQPELLCVWSAAAWVPPYSLPVHAPLVDIYSWAAPWSDGEKERKMGQEEKGRENNRKCALWSTGEIGRIGFNMEAGSWRKLDLDTRSQQKVTFFWTQLCRDTSFSICSRLPTSALSWLLRCRRAEFSSVRTRACSDSWLNCALTSIVSFMTNLTASGTLRFTKCSTSVRMDATRLSVSFSSLQMCKWSWYSHRTSQSKGLWMPF